MGETIVTWMGEVFERAMSFCSGTQAAILCPSSCSAINFLCDLKHNRSIVNEFARITQVLVNALNPLKQQSIRRDKKLNRDCYLLHPLNTKVFEKLDAEISPSFLKWCASWACQLPIAIRFYNY